ncbi:MAG: AMP-binding protein [Planctomycetota bacterium]
MSADPSWKELQHLDAAELRALQNRLLREHVVRRLYPFSPHYRRLFDEHGIDPAEIRRVEDLAELPLTSKQDLLPSDEEPDRARAFVLQPTKALIGEHWPLAARLPLLLKALVHGRAAVLEDLRREYRPIFTSFTTGRSALPVAFLYTAWDMDELAESGRRLLEVLAFERDWRVLNLFPYAPHLAFWQVAQAGLASGTFVLSTGGGKVAGTEGNLRALERMQPEAVVGVPGYLYHMLREARARDMRLPQLRRVVLGADAVPPGFKAKLGELLAGMGATEVSILGTYGFTEARMAFAECPATDGGSSGYHLLPDRGIFELVDPATGAVLPADADGELVYTPLTGRGTTVFRYRTGDLVEGGIRWDPCPHCGRTLPRIGSRLHRASSYKSLALKKIKGTLVNLEEIGQVLADDLAVEEWQVEIRKKDDDPLEVDELVLLVALRPGAAADEVRDRLRRLVMARTEVSPNEVRVLALDELLTRVGMEKEMKEKRFVDARVLQ